MSAAAARPSPSTLAGIALTVLACVFFASMDATSKLIVTSGVPVVVGLWGRYLFQAVLTAAVALPARGARVLHTQRFFFQCLRGVLLFLSSLFVFASLRYMAVGELTAIVMIAPLVVTLLAPKLLGEPVSPLRWVLVAGGFLGTLIIIRPVGESFSWVLLLPLGQVAANTAFQLLTSRLARTEDPLTTHVYTGLCGAVLGSLALPFVWRELASAWLWALLLLMGLCAAIGHFVLILGYQRAPAMTLTPYLYTQIGFAMAAGWLVFGHVPDAMSFAGMALIALCGIAGAWLTVLESRGATQAQQRPQA